MDTPQPTAGSSTNQEKTKDEDNGARETLRKSLDPSNEGNETISIFKKLQNKYLTEDSNRWLFRLFILVIAIGILVNFKLFFDAKEKTYSIFGLGKSDFLSICINLISTAIWILIGYVAIFILYGPSKLISEVLSLPVALENFRKLLDQVKDNTIELKNLQKTHFEWNKHIKELAELQGIWVQTTF